jgi:hypothetical protein
VRPEKQRAKDEPKATPPGQAKKHRSAAPANVNASEQKAKSKGATVVRLPAPAQTTPRPEQLAMPAAESNGQGDNGEKGNGPKK